MIKVRHAGITVNDMATSLDFYCGLLGLVVVKDCIEKGNFINKISGFNYIEVRTVKLADAEGGMIELLRYNSPPDKGPASKLKDVGCSHVAFTVDNVDRLFFKLRERGILFTCSPQISPDGCAKVTFCFDPDGVFVELVEALNGS